MVEGTKMDTGVYAEDELNEKVVAALGDLSTRACTLDGECASHGVPAYVGDYLLSRFGDDAAGTREAIDVLQSSGVVAEGMPPVGKDVVCRVHGARRMGDDVYGLSTPCPLLHRLGIEGEEVRAARLLDGSWCHLSVLRQTLDEFPSVECVDVDASEDEFQVVDGANYTIENLSVVRGHAEQVGRLLGLRSQLSTTEWTLLLLRSYGFEGEGLDARSRLCLLSRLAPLTQPGLRMLFMHEGEGLGSLEMSPYEGGADQLQSDYEGFPGSWDCAVVGEEIDKGACGLSLLLDDDEGVAAGISLAAVSDVDNVQLRKIKRLFGPFHLVVHAPQTVMPKADEREAHLGVNRCLLGELWHALRDKDLPTEAKKLLNAVSGLSAEREEAVRLAFAGIYRIISPAGDMSAGETEELLRFVLSATCGAAE